MVCDTPDRAAEGDVQSVPTCGTTSYTSCAYQGHRPCAETPLLGKRIPQRGWRKGEAEKRRGGKMWDVCMAMLTTQIYKISTVFSICEELSERFEANRV